jgi:hypothetical protein
MQGVIAMQNRTTLVALALALALTVAGTASAAGPMPLHSFTTTFSVHVPAIVPFGGPYCPLGHTLWSLSTEVCLDPIEYVCTEYRCTDPATGQSYRAPMRSGVNPSCVQNAFQTDACSNEISLREKALPTPQQLFDMLPMLYDKTYRNAPLLPSKP